GGIGAVATASGQAAGFVTVAALAGSGGRLVASSKRYGGTVTQLDVSLRRVGVDTTFVDSTEVEDFAAAIQPRTKDIYTEVVANPSGVIVDLEGLGKLAAEHGIPLVVDSTLTPPYLLRPLDMGPTLSFTRLQSFWAGMAPPWAV